MVKSSRLTEWTKGERKTQTQKELPNLSSTLHASDNGLA